MGVMGGTGTTFYYVTLMLKEIKKPHINFLHPHLLLLRYYDVAKGIKREKKFANTSYSVPRIDEAYTSSYIFLFTCSFRRDTLSLEVVVTLGARVALWSL